ncbi:hypothetical protein BX600DRAFT_456092 [Xylariales sp. PMI_506]|nr:hypothetical protein BX600DRAFT_456092 [Xylariales sp. PMI_506]
MGTVAEPKKDSRDRLCGIKRNVFVIVMAVGVFVLVVGIATGLGVGLALTKNNNNNGTSSTSTSTAGSPTTSSTASTPSFTGTVGTAPVTCPQDNGIVFVSSGTGRAYNIVCGHDYNSDEGSSDIRHQATSTMDDCIDLCASTISCVGAGWGTYNGAKVCWLKSHLGQPNDSPGWTFAILQNNS